MFPDDRLLGRGKNMQMINEQITERISKLREEAIQQGVEMEAERAMLVTESYMETEGEPIVVRRAKCLKKLLNEKKIYIGEGELIVGNHSQSLDFMAPVFPETSFEWLMDMKNWPNIVRASNDTRKKFSEIYRYWKNNTVYDRAKNLMTEKAKMATVRYGMGLFTPMCPWMGGVGHVAPNYRKVLEKGFIGIKKDAEECLEKLGAPVEPDDLKKYHFWRSVVIVCDAVTDFAGRYAKLALKLSVKEDDSRRKAELKQIADNCQWVATNPPRTFWEACQAFWFVQLVIQLETSGHSISPGRFDQYMYPFYQKDIDEDRISKDQAQELIECLFIKTVEIGKVADKLYEAQFGTSRSLAQNLIVGGQTRDGQDATNELSYLCLDAMMDLKVHSPSITARFSHGSPEKLWRKAVELAKLGYGHPSFHNDDVIIPLMLNKGISLEDARDYCSVGCVEVDAQGKEYGWRGAVFFNLVKCLELALNNGQCLECSKECKIYPKCVGAGKNGIGLPTGDLSTCKSFEEVQEAYKKQVEYFVKDAVVAANAVSFAHQELLPLPFLSCFIDPCIERGIDMSAGGAKYNYACIDGVGTGTVADSLSVIKKLIFEERKFTGAELLETLKTNWEGKEALRQRVITKAPHYGTDNPYADELARWALRVFCDDVRKYKEPKGGRYLAGGYSLATTVLFGQRTGPTPDGRMSGEIISDNVSPVQGRAEKGLTAAFKSVARLDHEMIEEGASLPITLHPTVCQGDKGTSNLVAAIKVYFDLGGSHTMFNMVSAEILRDSQKNPSKYLDLLVRISGYCTYFIFLDKKFQDELIARTEHEAI